MNYEKFIAEIRRRAEPISRGEAEAVTGAYLETLRERLSGDLPGKHAAHLPDKFANYFGGEEYPVWEFHERFTRKAGAQEADEQRTCFRRES